MQEVFNGIKQLEERGYGDAKGRAIDLFIGSTRCGKSTTLNIILGNELEVVESGFGLHRKKAFFTKVEDAEGKYPEIGEGSISKTTIPVMYEKDGQAIWDCPGFGDTRGSQQEIINAWFINRLFETAGSVRFFNLISEEALTSENPVQFMTYVRQIQDVFGEANLKTVDQVIVFTKASKEFSVAEYKDALMKLLKAHFPELEALHDLFDRARTVKLDKPVDAVGTGVALNYVEELLEVAQSIPHKELTTNVGVNSEAKTFLYEAASDLYEFTKTTIIEGYKESYASKSMIRAIVEKLQETGEERDAKNLSELLAVKLEEIDKLHEEDNSITRNIKIVKDVKDFILKMIPSCTALEMMVESVQKSIETYQNNVARYEVTKEYLKYLIENSTNIISRGTLVDKWTTTLSDLEQPNKTKLFDNLKEIEKGFIDVQATINQATGQIDTDGAQVLSEEYRKKLEAAQQEYSNNMEAYRKGIEQASKFSAIGEGLGAIGKAIGTVWAPAAQVGEAAKGVSNAIANAKLKEQPTYTKPVQEIDINSVLDISLSEYVGHDVEFLGSTIEFFTEI